MSPQTLTLSLAEEQQCAPCRDRVVAAVRDCPGVLSAEPVGGGSALSVAFEEPRCTPAQLEQAVERVRGVNAERFDHHDVQITGMDCADCVTRVQAATSRVDQVTAVDVNLAGERMRIELAAGSDLDAVRERVERLGYGFQVPSDGAPDEPAPTPTRSSVLSEWLDGSDRVTLAAAAALLAGGVSDVGGAPRAVVIGCYLASIVIGGVSIARTGVRAAAATRTPDMNLLMAIAVIGAAAIGAWTEASLVVVLFSIGELLERRAVGRARRQLASLVALTPATARVLRGHAHADGAIHEQELEIPAAQLVRGDRLVVRPGERIAADGVIASGATAVDQAAVTGESVPVDRGEGDSVFAGTLNGPARIIVTVTNEPGDSTLDRIARMVRDAQSQQSQSERWVTAFARRYTPAVVVLALTVATLLPAAGAYSWSTGLYSALALLILACPCALVLSTPVTIVSALGRASSAGVLVKGGAFLEQAARIDTVAFDKTGTLTEGRPHVVAVISTGDFSETAVLLAAAAVEAGSEHPLAAAIVAHARSQGHTIRAAQSITAHVGLGASGTTDGQQVSVGDARMFPTPDATIEAILKAERQLGRTAVIVEIAGQQAGVISLADQPRPEAKQAIEDLAQLGITNTMMLSGDNAGAAQTIAAAVGITKVHAGLLPGDKQDLLAALPGTTAMVGDGVNDAPALARADLGVAMGTAGSDTAIEVADIAIIGDDPRKLAALIGLARWTRSVVQQNIAFSLATKAIAALLLLAGALPLWGAVATDVGASLLVVANGLRVARGLPHGPARNQPLLSTTAPATP